MTAALLSKFESIGENCEFGLLQRKHGVEYSNIFRWSFSYDIRDVVRIIQSDFSGIFDFENLVPRPGGDMVYDIPNGIAFHSDMKSSFDGRAWNFVAHLQELHALYARDKSKIGHLSSNTRRSLSSAERVFVYKRNASASNREVELLYKAIARFNSKNRLLWVQDTKSAASVGKVECIRDGLFTGFVDRFAPHSDASDFSEAAWLQLLEAFVTLAGDGSATAGATRRARLWQAKKDTVLWVGTTLEGGRQQSIRQGQALVGVWEAVYEPYFELREVALDGEPLKPDRYFIEFRDWHAD